jgi:hypothetical protein
LFLISLLVIQKCQSIQNEINVPTFPDQEVPSEHPEHKVFWAHADTSNRVLADCLYEIGVFVSWRIVFVKFDTDIMKLDTDFIILRFDST